MPGPGTTLSAIALALLLAGPAGPCREVPAADVATYAAGEIRIVRLVDHAKGVPTSLLHGADQSVLDELAPGGICPNSISAFLLEGPGDQGPVLIDAGYGELNPGDFAANLQAAGYSMDALRTVILTHLHPDHIGGLMAGQTRTFPRATLHVNETELAFWSDRANMARAPESLRACFDLVERLRAVYGENLRTFRDGEKVVPWLTPLTVPGHTAGHTMFILESAGEKRFLWGDIMHCMAVQARYPDVTIAFDSDENEARETRKRILGMVADTGIPVFGEHLPNPGVWTFHALPDGGYRAVAVEPGR